MKIAIINKADLKVQTWYDDAAPNQAKYGGPWGDPKQTAHIGLEEGMDQRAVEFVLEGNEIVAIEDEELKAQLVQQDTLRAITAAVAAAQTFGQKLMIEFAAENVMLGITQAGKTGEVLDKMAPTMAAMSSGSLYEAMDRAKAIDPADYDSTFVTHDRLWSFINKIEAYLGLPLSL